MRTKQVRPNKLEYEYELYISHKFDSTLKKNYILFDFRTTKVFENYIYKINVTEKLNPENKKLDFDIEGLSAPIVSISKINLPSASNHVSYSEARLSKTESPSFIMSKFPHLALSDIACRNTSVKLFRTAES